MVGKKNRPSLDLIDQLDPTGDTTDVTQAIIIAEENSDPTRKALHEAIGELDIAQLRDIFEQHGLEVHHMRTNHPGTISRAGGVKGKTKLGVWLSKPTREALENARHATRTKISHIVEEAIEDWIAKKGLRVV